MFSLFGICGITKLIQHNVIHSFNKLNIFHLSDESPPGYTKDAFDIIR